MNEGRSHVSLGTGHTTLPGVLLCPWTVVVLWELSDHCLGVRVQRGWALGETGWFDKHAMTRWTAEIHSSLDRPIVLAYRERNPNYVCIELLESLFHYNISLNIFLLRTTISPKRL